MICNEKRDVLKDRVMRKIIAVLVILAFVFPVMTPEVFAASNISITGGDDVRGGETFTVTVTYSGSDIGSVNGTMEYDTGMLTYIDGGSSSGNTGNIQLKGYGNGSVTFDIKFQAVAEGSTTLDVSTYEMYSVNDEYLDNPSASKTVNITGDAAEEDLITQETEDPPEKVKEPEGVDEKGDEGEYTVPALIISAAVLLVVIVIIAVVLIRRRRK